MPDEAITLRAESGETTPATAEVVRYGPTARTVRSVAFIVGGLLGGAACIIIPVLHLITTWGLPLLGIVLGVRAYRTERKILSVAGACPSCHERMAIPGGTIDASNRRDCPKCRATFTVMLDPGHGDHPAP